MADNSPAAASKPVAPAAPAAPAAAPKPAAPAAPAATVRPLAPAKPKDPKAPTGKKLRVKAVKIGTDNAGRRRKPGAVFMIAEDPQKPGHPPSWCVLVDDDNNPLDEEPAAPGQGAGAAPKASDASVI